jgi:HPt (histidine-containing phosphotransfer) domain-containing protein
MTDWKTIPELDEKIISALKSAVGVEPFYDMSKHFAEDLSNLCVAHGDARGRNNADAAREAAHAIKGAAANIGLTRLSALAGNLEAGDQTDADQLDAVFGSGISKLQHRD